MSKDNIVWEKFQRAVAFAKEKHKGQLDDSGKDYFYEHLWRVHIAVGTFVDNEDIECAAILHDIIEDTDTTYEELLEKFGKRVADLVNEVTHEGKKDEHGYYFPRLKTADGILIKLCDRASNVSRMKCWNRHRRQNYLDKSKFWKSDGPENKK
ncbi:hypothetical protein LCGC14_0441770 [marine sediment metagenome]|uniref:HD/PDEase domain-containing protein n=1 Tax=marine sediment metagenome TaxID=412755 RepID=A0A0F9VUC0_9ZZZZ